MAKKKDDIMEADGQSVQIEDAAQAETSESEGAAQSEASESEGAAQPEASKTEDVATATGGELESLSVLADRHRVPTWQQASVCRLMGWADGKAVTNAEYMDALEKLKTRRVGGGRMG